VKEIQRHPVRRTVQHVDFIYVNLNEVIEVEVPIVLTGESAAVKAANGLVDPALNTLTIVAKPADIPTEITIDVSDMEIGHAIRVSDITLPAGVTCPLDPDTVVVTAEATRASMADEEDAEGAEGAEGDSGDAGAGEAEAAAEGGDAE
jgi:large subunit ribosomal protein L25